MRRLAVILVVALLATGCAGSIAENSQANLRLYRSFEEIAAAYTIEYLEDTHTHFHGEFNEVVPGGGASREWDETTREGLEYRARNIVIGRVLNDANIVLQFSEVTGQIIIGGNVVSLEIMQVIKGDLTVGEIIRIGEPYFIYEGVLYAYSDYLPSIPYQEYMFFLGGQITESRVAEYIGVFTQSHGERSRFPMPGPSGPGARTLVSVMHYLGDDGTFDSDTQNFGSALFGLGSRANVEVYASLWEEVMNEYVLPTLTGIDLRPGEAIMEVGDELSIHAVVLPATDSVTGWSSSNESVATVSNTGVVTAVGRGAATITATTADGQEGTAEVLVIGEGAVNIGDVNGDGVVDFLDLLVLIYYLDNNGNISDEHTFIHANADLNGDGIIDDLDLELLMIFLDVLGVG